MTSEKPDHKPVRMDLSPAMHRRFRVEAARIGISMSALACRLADAFLSNNKMREYISSYQKREIDP